MNEKTIKEVITGEGIFYYLQQANPTYYSDIFNETEYEVLDAQYLGYAGNKPISPFCELIIETTNEVVDDDSGSRIAKTIWASYYKAWERLKAAVETEESYDTTYRITSETTTTEDASKDDSSQLESKVYGFNSETSVPDSDENTTANSTSTSKEVTTHTQSGALGYFSQAQLIKGEYEVEKLNLLASIFDDINELLTLDIYY